MTGLGRLVFGSVANDRQLSTAVDPVSSSIVWSQFDRSLYLQQDSFARRLKVSNRNSPCHQKLEATG